MVYGTPRRTVDLQYLNAATYRETHHVVSPFNQASVPAKSKRQFLMHGIVIILSLSRDVYYRVGQIQISSPPPPQGFYAAGDAYTRRYSDMIIDVPRKSKCVDDTILWDATLSKFFWHTFAYIELCASYGIVFNPKLFSFARE